MSNYNIDNCKYSIDKFEKKVFLLPKNTMGEVLIDNGEAYIQNPTAVPTLLDGFALSFTEESSLDKRYQFDKEVKLSVRGFYPRATFDDDYHVILKDKNDVFWVMNVDFKCEVTYVFNLQQNQYQTELTFKCISNFPTLRLRNTWDIAEINECKPYIFNHLDYFNIIDRDNVLLDKANKRVYILNDAVFHQVEPLKNTLAIQENFDGDKVTTTVNFSIKLDSSWHYNLEEFAKNKKSVIITAQDNSFYCGFNFGLIPQFNITGTSQSDESSVVQITLTEDSNESSVAANDIEADIMYDYVWKVVNESISGLPYYDCVSGENARYLLKEKYNILSVPQAEFLCMTGYESWFEDLNIVGTFSDPVILPCSKCAWDYCNLTTDAPSTLMFSETASAATYHVTSNCPWTITTSESWLRVASAATSFTLTVNATPSTTVATVTLASGAHTITIEANYKVTAPAYRPSYYDTTCLAQTVRFELNTQDYDVSVISITENLPYDIDSNILKVYLPTNESVTESKTYEVELEICEEINGSMDCHYETIEINQDMMYEEWRETNNNICDNGVSYQALQRYTGITSSSSAMTPTMETKKGSQILGDNRCKSYYTRWFWNGTFICEDGGKFKAEILQESTDGEVWRNTATQRLGELVEAQSLDCLGEDYLTFVARTNLAVSFYSSISTNTLQYSTDNGATWTTLQLGSWIPVVESGSKVLFKGNCTPNGIYGIGTFETRGDFDLEGNPLSLVYGDGYHNVTDISDKSYLLSGLFKNTSVINANKLALVATTLSNGCYYEMFKGCAQLVSTPKLLANTLTNSCYGYMYSACTSLTEARELPATTLATQSYIGMFKECTSLTTAPELPATTLAINCYGAMFSNCSSLKTPPTLLATTLAKGCYQLMFANCTSLTEAPTLEAETVPSSAYAYMFSGCYMLNTIRCYATTFESNATVRWVRGVSNLGTFFKSSDASWSSGISGIPTNWTIIDE